MMNEELSRVATFLENSGYRFRCHPEAGVILLTLRCDKGCYEIHFHVRSEFMLTISATPGLLVPEGARRDIAVAVNHANKDLSCGHFEICMDSGDLWFRFKVPLLDTFPSNDMLAFSIAAVSRMTDRYLPAFLAIIYGNEQPKDAIASAESALISSPGT